MICFGGLESAYSDYKNSKIVILPVPYDGTSTWLKGADKGPRALLEASANMELYDIETGTEVYKMGIHTAPPVTEKKTPKRMTEAVYRKVSYYLSEQRFMVTLGGEHSISIGAIKAHVEKFPGLTVLQIDAHTDLRPSYEGSKYNHACVMARTREIADFVQVGIRSMDALELPFVKEGQIFYAHNIRSNPHWMSEALAMMGPEVYLTFDLDGLDPSVMSSTGTPEPGGLDYPTVINFLSKVIEQKNLVGFDVVELCPNKFNKAPDFLAAKLVYRILSMKFNKSQLHEKI